MALYTLAHMYPDLMNLYGDRGNLFCLRKRLEWYGHSCSIKSYGLGDNWDCSQVDMIFMGGGSDREQELVYRDLLRKSDRLMAEIESGLPVLAICGAYQLLGSSYHSSDGKLMDGLRFFDFYTRGEEGRLIGNIVLNSKIDGKSISVVGFENHGGRTYFQDSSLEPFGTVVKGYGNNGKDRTEGIRYHNLIGSYLHGPLLPKNPAIADFYIRAMSERKGIEIDMELDDYLENYAHQQVLKKAE